MSELTTGNLGGRSKPLNEVQRVDLPENLEINAS